MTSHVVSYLVPRSGEDARPVATALPQTAAPPAARCWPLITAILSVCFVTTAFTVLVTTGLWASGYSPKSYTDLWGLEISLRNFSVSNLSIADDRISGNWSIELGLNNPYRRTNVLYTNIKFTVVYSGAVDAPIVDSLGSGRPLFQPPMNQTTVNLNGSPKNVRLSHQAASSMARDVIYNGAVEFDLVTVALIVGGGKDGGGELRLVLSCSGVKILISPSKLADPMSVTGRASEIPVCDLVRLVDI